MRRSTVPTVRQRITRSVRALARATYLEIHLNPPRPLERIVATDLREAGDAGAHGKSLPLAFGVRRNVLRNRRTRTDQAHVPSQHIQICGNSSKWYAQEATKRKHTRVFIPRCQRVSRRSAVHAAEFDHREQFAVPSDPRLPEQGGTRAREFTPTAMAANSGHSVSSSSTEPITSNTRFTFRPGVPL